MPGVSFVYLPVFEAFRIVSEIVYDIVALIWSALASVRVVILFGYTASIFCLLPRMTGRAVLINVDGLEWKRKKFARPVRSILKLAELISPKVATGIICDSRSIQDYYSRRYSARSQYIPNPVSEQASFNPAFLKQLGLAPRSYYLVVARLEPENHCDMVVAGFQRARTRRKLVVVGPLIRTRFVEKLVKMSHGQVRFVGGVYDRAALNTLRKESFAYIHGHEVGGTNPSLLESMAAGSPIIALDVPFNREVAQNAALYFKDEKELAQRIHELENNHLQRKIMETQAQSIAMREYSTEKVVNGYAEVIAKILND
jgi:rhamnosyltransferase